MFAVCIEYIRDALYQLWLFLFLLFLLLMLLRHYRHEQRPVNCVMAVPVLMNN